MKSTKKDMKPKRVYVRKVPYQKKSSTFTATFFRAAILGLLVVEAYFLVRSWYGR